MVHGDEIRDRVTARPDNGPADGPGCRGRILHAKKILIQNKSADKARFDAGGRATQKLPQLRMSESEVTRT